jgi:DNA repair protein RecN (Recombination protein N)
MLRELRVRDLAVIESVTVPFGAGLNVLTGETGAGKSIVIDAVLLLLGARAQADAIRSEAEAARVEGVFALAPGSPAAEVLDEAGLRPEDGEIVVRREVVRSGRHRAFVNDSPVSVALLERLGGHLVHVHGQHEHQRLAETSAQLALLDRFAGVEATGARVAALHGKYRVACEALARQGAAERDRAQREDLLRFQVSEVDAAHLRPGEEEELRAERRRLQHAERFRAGLGEAELQLDDEAGSALSRVGRAVRVLRDLGRLEPAMGAPAEALETAAALLEEALAGIRRLHQGLAADPGRLEEVDERLEVIARLRRKYGESEEAMLAFRDTAAAELDRLARHEEVLAEQERLQDQLRAELEAAAGELSDRRAGAGRRLQALVEREIRTLGMERGVFRIALERLATVSTRGWDRAEFRLAANPGDEPKALARVASGGELSRAMLALLAVLAAAEDVPTVVFDEIDAGIGGHIAAVVGDRLAVVAGRRQVLCVTHLAQIATRAQHHLRVTKAVRGGRARAGVERLAGEARVSEIARMLGGETQGAVRHARELLGAARRPRRAGADQPV